MEQDKKMQALYRRFFRGEKTAIIELVQLYREGLILFINGYVRNTDVAEDLASDTFARLLIKKPKIRSDLHFKTYLFSMGKNAALSYLRKRKRLVDLDLEKISYDDFESAWLIGEERKTVFRALQSLGEDYASVLFLRYYEELTVESIAQVMKKNKKQIYNLLQRAKEALRERLKKEGLEYEAD